MNNQFWIKILNFPFFLSNIGEVDALHAGDNDGANIGKWVVPPSSHQVSPRHMHQNYLDAMRIICNCGKLDSFITMTCNPNCSEMANNLRYNEKASDIF